MKRILIFGMLIIACNSGLYAQESINLDELKAPSSPAAYVLGIQPSAIVKPSSYKSLQTSLYSNFVNDDGQAVIPDDFALEFSPYWTSDHGLTLDEYLYPDDVIKDQIWRNSLFSIASTQNYLLGDSTATNAVSIGYRTSIHLRKAGSKSQNQEIEKSIEKYESTGWVTVRFVSQLTSELLTIENLNQQKALDKAIEILSASMEAEGYSSQQKNDVLKIFDSSLVNLIDVTQNEDGFVDQLAFIVLEVLDSDALFEELKKQISIKKGIIVDIAYATVINFPVNEFNSAIAPRHAFWVTPSYNFKKGLDFLTLSGVVRYERYDTDYYEDFFPSSTVFRNNWDLGASTSLSFNKLTLDFETVFRTSRTLDPTGMLDANGDETFTKDEDSDFQAVGSFTYIVNDGLSFTYSLGNQFEPILNPGNTLVSQFGISLAFGALKNTDLILPRK